MKVKQLIETLSKLDPNAEVILSSDAEGNSKGILYEVYAPKDLRFYKDDYEINLMTKEDIDDDAYSVEEIKDNRDVYKKSKPAIVLYPA